MEINNKNLVRYARTDEQLEVLEDIIPVLNKKGISLRFGTAVGKHPQTIIFDKEYQDGILRINSEGYMSEYLPTYNDEEFISAIQLESLIDDSMGYGGKTYAEGGEILTLKDLRSGMYRSGNSIGNVSLISSKIAHLKLSNGDTYVAKGFKKGTTLKKGDIVLGAYNKYNQGADLYEILGVTGDEEEYGKGGVKFNSVKECLNYYEAKNLVQLEKITEEIEKQKGYGHHPYLYVKDLETGEEGAWFYLYEGRWSRGSGAEPLTFIEMQKTEAKMKKGGTFTDLWEKTKMYGKKAAKATKKGYEKGKKAVKDKIHDEKKKIALNVIDSTKDKVKDNKSKLMLKAAEEIVTNKYAKGGSIKKGDTVKIQNKEFKIANKYKSIKGDTMYFLVSSDSSQDKYGNLITMTLNEKELKSNLQYAKGDGVDKKEWLDEIVKTPWGNGRIYEISGSGPSEHAKIDINGKTHIMNMGELSKDDIIKYSNGGGVGEIKFIKTNFNSHENHNPEYDILEGYLNPDTFITYTIKVKGNNLGKESMEIYTGENYVVGSKNKSSSRHYEIDKIPAKYKPYWLRLKEIYENKQYSKGGNINGFVYNIGGL